MILHMVVQTMRFLKLMPILPASAMILMAASCSSGKTDYESAILEWTGREIVFPDSMRLAGGGVFVKEPSDFTIVAYYDSEGCTGCRMKLPFWNQLIWKLDSLKNRDRVEVLLIVATERVDELTTLIKENSFPGKVVVDSDSLFMRANGLPENPYLQSFLLDSDNRVTLIGNPIDMHSLEKVYLKNIMQSDFEESEEDDIDSGYEHDFGKIAGGRSVSHTFNMLNETADTLKVGDIASSCECTVGRVSMAVIPPGKAYSVDVTFRDTIPGEFHRTVTLYFDNRHREIRFGISGEIITQ